MINVVEDLIKIFEALNIVVGKKLISKDALQKAHNRLSDFKKLEYDMVDFLNEINNFNGDDMDELDMFLLLLHIEISNGGWHIGEVRELIEIIMGRYRKLVREQGYAKD